MCVYHISFCDICQTLYKLLRHKVLYRKLMMTYTEERSKERRKKKKKRKKKLTQTILKNFVFIILKYIYEVYYI